MVALAGGAVDYMRASNVKTRLQAALDSALLAGARNGTIDWASLAEKQFASNSTGRDATVDAPVFALDKDRAYTGIVKASVRADFLGLLGISSIPVTARARAAVTSTTNTYYCVLALNNTERAALQLTGNASILVNAPNCVIQVNSRDTLAVQMTGNSTIKSVKNCFAGGLSTVGNAVISPAPDPTCAAVPDPFEKYPRPAVGSCDFTNFSYSGGKSVTLQPGVYCGGMSFSGPVDVTFAPGLFIVKDGVIKESGGNFQGTDVSFFLTGAGAAIQLSGQANWKLQAPATGPLPGFAIFLEPDGPTGKAAADSFFAGQAELFFEGIIYLPKQRVTVTGQASAIAPSPYTSYIGDTLRFVGNGELVINNDVTKTALPIPTALMVQTGGKLALTN